MNAEFNPVVATTSKSPIDVDHDRNLRLLRGDLLHAHGLAFELALSDDPSVRAMGARIMRVCSAAEDRLDCLVENTLAEI